MISKEFINSDLGTVLKRLGKSVSNAALWEIELGKDKPSEEELLAEWEVLKNERLEQTSNEVAPLSSLKKHLDSQGYDSLGIWALYDKRDKAAKAGVQLNKLNAVYDWLNKQMEKALNKNVNFDTKPFVFEDVLKE